MRSHLAWVLLGLSATVSVACKDAGARPSPVVPSQPAQPAIPVAAEPAAALPKPIAPPPPTGPRDELPATPDVTVEIASVTLGDDCGAAAARASAGDSVAGAPPPARAQVGASAMAKMARACEQTSVQLSLRAGPGAASPSIEVRQVRLTDASGASLGALIPRGPVVWSADGAYVPWDQTIEPGETLSVAYALSAPEWGKIGDRYGKTYRLEVTLAIGGVERAVQKEVRISAPTIMPPNVAT